MKDIRNEDHFQREVIRLTVGAGAHVQPFQNLEWPGVPDLSVGWNTRDFWLELKYARCGIRMQEYDRFEFSTLKAAQLAWLEERASQSLAFCGILGYVVVPPGRHVDYICYYPASTYRSRVWRNEKYSVAAMILSEYSIPADEIKTGEDLLRFIWRTPDEDNVQRR